MHKSSYMCLNQYFYQTRCDDINQWTLQPKNSHPITCDNLNEINQYKSQFLSNANPIGNMFSQLKYTSDCFSYIKRSPLKGKRWKYILKEGAQYPPSLSFILFSLFYYFFSVPLSRLQPKHWRVYVNNTPNNP